MEVNSVAALTGDPKAVAAASRHHTRVHLVSKRATRQQREWRAKGALIVDVTSTSHTILDRLACKRLSPFYPHGGFPVPGLDGETSASVEGVWQGLKVFDVETGPKHARTPALAIDRGKFAVSDMKNLKRSARRERKRVPPIGHWDPVLSREELPRYLGYVAARRGIYLPLFDAQLRRPSCVAVLEAIVARLRRDKHRHLVLLDYFTNDDIAATRVPMSHAALVKERLLQLLGDEEGDAATAGGGDAVEAASADKAGSKDQHERPLKRRREDSDAIERRVKARQSEHS